MAAKIDYQYTRKLKSKVLKEWHDDEFVLRDDLKAYCYNDATILPLRKFNEDSLMFGRGGVIDSNNEYIEISGISRRIEKSYIFDDCKFMDQKVVYCGYLINHWGHFLVEAVSRLWYFLKNDDSIDKYVFFLDYGECRAISGNYKEFFELLGVWDKIEFINKPTRYREVIIPELGYKWREYYSNEYKEIFETISKNSVVNNNLKPYKKIYLTRKYLKKAQNQDIGSDMLDEYFEENGYQLISPEKISLSELIFLLNNSEICASLSGSLPHNMLFAKDKKQLIIIERNVLNNEIQVDVNNIKDLNVTYIDGNIGIYPINVGCGPYILLYNDMLKKFTIDNHYKTPNYKYCNKVYYRRIFYKYMKEYKKLYNYSWFMFDWMIQYTNYIYEAYEDSLKYFGEYMNRSEPFKFSQNFQLHFIKKRIKKLLGR